MSISSSGSSSKDLRGVGPHSLTDDGGDGMGPLAGMATMKNTFLEFGTPAHETSFRQRSKTLPVVPNMQELLQGSLVKGALESGTHCAAFNEEEEGMSDDEDDDDNFMIQPDRPLGHATMSHGSGMVGSKSSSSSPPPPTVVSSPTIDQLIAMQLLATLQTQQLQQGYTGAQFGLGCSNHFCRRGRRRHSSDGTAGACCVDSDDDLSASEASSSYDGIGDKEYTLMDLDKEIAISPRRRRGYGQQAPVVVTPSRINSGGTRDDCDTCVVGDDDGCSSSTKTTVMLRNIPNKYTQKILLNAIDGRGFECTYDFFYLPIDFRNRCNLGYAFLNFTTHESAVAFTRSFNGYSLPAFKSTKVCWARVQGLEANVEHYRNSPVNEMPHNEYKPMLFVEGHPVEFPRPLSEGGDQRPLVVHQTPQHTGGGILQAPPPKHVQQDGTAGSGGSSSSMIRRNKIFIGGLSVTSTSEAIRQHFMKWGRVTEAAVITDKKTGQSRGFGFCTYAHDVPDEVLTAEHWVDGRNIGVRIYASGPPSATAQQQQPTGAPPSSRNHPDFGFIHAPPPHSSTTTSSSSSLAAASSSTRDYLTLLSQQHRQHYRGQQQQSPH